MGSKASPSPAPHVLMANKRIAPGTAPAVLGATRENETSTRPSRRRAFRSPYTPLASSDSCRFIPSRSQARTPWHEHCIRQLFDEDEASCGVAGSFIPALPRLDEDTAMNRQATDFKKHLLAALFESTSTPRLNKILQFRNLLSTENEYPGNVPAMRDVVDRNRDLDDPTKANRPRVTRRHICSTPDRILDSPDLIDDYYLNLLSWSSQNVVAIALANAVYIWNASTATTTMLMRTANLTDSVSSVSWSGDGTKLAIGTTNKTVELWELERRKLIRTIRGHDQRVSVLAWRTGSASVLTSGSRDASIRNHDVRMSSPTTDRMVGHTQEVCGMQWSPDGTQLASGGNDNLSMIWDVKALQRPRHTLDKHQAAVKAIAWCPFQSRLLATGGGTADRTIRFWNSSSGQCVGGIDTQSQVCGLVWNTHERELLSAHGFSKNQLTIWSYPTMNRVVDLVGHTSRVLHLAMSPDSTTVCSASADETLRFWKVFRAPDHKHAGGSSRGRLPGQQQQGALRSLVIR